MVQQQQQHLSNGPFILDNLGQRVPETVFTSSLATSVGIMYQSL